MKINTIIGLLTIGSLHIALAQNNNFNVPTIPGKNLKNVVAQYEKGLNEVLKLNPIIYKYNGNGGIKDTGSKHVGLLAEEYLKIAPQSAKAYTYSTKGKSSKATEQFSTLDASQLIYMLINAVKEQQIIIDDFKEEFKALKDEKAIAASDHIYSQHVSLNDENEKALLAQNVPNPFYNNTKIEYFKPANTKKAAIAFLDINGKEIKRVKLTNIGIGNINVSLQNLSTGVYAYTLIVDGKVIDTKEMLVRY